MRTDSISLLVTSASLFIVGLLLIADFSAVAPMFFFKTFGNYSVVAQQLKSLIW